MDSIDRLAKRIAEMHKANRNPPSTAPRVGTVVSASPIKIQYGNSIILEERHLIIEERLMIDGLEVDDKVILQPDESLTLWFVLGRVWKEPET